MTSPTISDLLQFCCDEGVICGFDQREHHILIDMRFELLTFEAEDDAALFLRGALKYRPDLLQRFESRAGRAGEA